MENEAVEVQGPVSRQDSVRHRLGYAAWRAGASVFVADGVPFSFTTGPVLARCVCDFVGFLIEGDPQQALTLHDVGAGTGYLTRHVIETLARRSPDLARACQYLASDNSPEMIAAMSGVFAGLPQDLEVRVTARAGNALSAEDILDGAPSVVLMSYLVDAVPPIHVAQSDDDLHEVLAQTWVVTGQPVLDASIWPPRILEGEALAEVLETSPESLSPGAVLQSIPLIVEAAVEGQILSADTANVIASSLPFYNTRPGVASMIRELVARLGEESIVLITDFGYSAGEVPNELDALMTEYGATTCFAVFFDELVAAAEAEGATCRVHSVAAGGTHVLAIYKGARKDMFTALFDKTVKGMDPDHQGLALLDGGQVESLEDVQEAERSIRQQMTSGELPSYASFANLAHLFAAFGSDDEARVYAMNCETSYRLVAAPEQLLLGDLAARQDNLDQALEWYERARTTASTYGPTHVKAAEVYLQMGRYSNYAETMKAYVYVTDESVGAHVKWLMDVEGQDPQEVPENVRREFSRICQAEFGGGPSDGDAPGFGEGEPGPD